MYLPSRMRKLTHTVIALVTLVLLLVTLRVAAETPAAKNFVTPLDGSEEVPPRDTNAAGQTKFRLSDDGTELHYKLIVANIENVVAAHIHLGPVGLNAPVVAFLAGPFPPGGGRTEGILAEGTITGANLVGPLAGQPLETLIVAMKNGGTYVNVHTNDGVDPIDTGPGDFPGGEIRGQIRTAGPTK